MRSLSLSVYRPIYIYIYILHNAISPSINIVKIVVDICT